MGVLVLSDGLDRVVGSVLRAAGLDLPFFANRLEWQGADRWKLAFPFARRGCTAPGKLQMQPPRQRRNAGSDIMVGDGRSDFCIAENSHLVLAKGRLAGHCRSKNFRIGRSRLLGRDPFLAGWLPATRASQPEHSTVESNPGRMTIGNPRLQRDLSWRPAGFLLIHGLGGTPAELRFVGMVCRRRATRCTARSSRDIAAPSRSCAPPAGRIGTRR